MALKTLLNGLQASYNLNGDALDSSGTGNDGTLQDGLGFNTAKAKVGSGCLGLLNGTSQYLSIPLQNHDEISVSLHIYRSIIQPSGVDTFFGNWKFSGDPQLNEGFDLARFPDTGGRTICNFTLISKTVGDVRTAKTIVYDIGDTSGGYVHILGTYKSSTGLQSLIIDGVLRGTNTHPAGNTVVPQTSYADIMVGSSRVNTAYANGYVDILNIWNRPITDGGVSIGEVVGGEAAMLYNLDRGFELKNEIYVPIYKPRRR